MTKVLVLDAGHGLTTPGKQTMNGKYGIIKEWDLNNKVLLYVMEYLKNYAITIYRTDDPTGKTDIPLLERVKRCNAYAPDLFISIHHNAGGGTGIEVYWHTKGTREDKKIAEIVAPKLATSTGMKNRGVKQEAWTVLTCKATAILVEGGFMDTQSDYEYMCTEKGQRAYAKAIADSVIECLALEKKVIEQKPVQEENQSTTTTNNKWYQVVVGSYLGKNKANEIKAKLEARGYTGVWIDVVKKDNQTYYRVICGSYQDRLNAEQIKAKLDKFYTGVWINVK
ncbi:N-acetylmuramoyl-L-alanine amidase [Turicibacter sanguinis]|uniref:N-acetylmuramoyl-L-alanine amidase n=1 Tax=Turicibacter sanguinis TaxID=154288 RepID=UPI0018AB2851|nr:N-acetylmuramoyl-L-alanine amidase [Turicibacter sanguinis]MDB8567714.1 N-acetylmuramoyl-L-alanine amidase [Turicibacter sanguinis]MDB8570457.1 N-acetylmuramoyl-L-alanine amidase [Turicibacter sanguinis]MDB8573220.1 N-acetylmuramoyl-L-alanine amidase [Turicibacter sanguinis]MDB8581971.1 N-acetylmuramoyl-L-alanine amidase [Turicibacter sanguinis]